MYTDPIADMLTRLRNAAQARIETVMLPYSGMKQKIADVMKTHGYIADYSVSEDGGKQTLAVRLQPGRTLHLRRISKPGQRIYKKYEDIKLFKGGYGVSILTTSQGIMTDKEARMKKIGGEIICEVF